VVPLIGVGTGTEGFGVGGVTIELLSWAVFVVDLVVHLRLRRRYLRTGVGRFDLAVVLLTSPWYLIPGAGGGEVVALLRLARLARVLMVAARGPVIRRTIQRLGRPFLYAVVALLVSSIIVYRAEDGKAGFETYGDALWWGVVTITTVGYGDLIPSTPVARYAATALMVAGVALLGTIAASLASLFRLEDVADEKAAADAGAAAAAAAAAEHDAAAAASNLRAATGTGAGAAAVPVPTQAAATDLAAELRALRAEVAALRAQLEAEGHRDP
jgi:voltage-gated potassium channel